MHKRRLLTVLGLVLLGFTLSLSVGAFNVAKYATSSKLSSGKWVKIKIPASGVYELTAQELAEMGFSNPDNVKIYGSGGYMISEVLDGKAVDDLAQVPVFRTGDKLCFYAKGPVKFTFESPLDVPHYARTINAYSTAGYYFLSEDGDDLTIEERNSQETGNINYNDRNSSYDYFYHEKEITSPSYSGKTLLGENLNDGNTFSYSLPGLIATTPISVNVCLAANLASRSHIFSALHPQDSELAPDTVKFSSGSSLIKRPDKTFLFFNTASPIALVTPKTHNENGQLEIGIDYSTGSSNWARLDYFILTYLHQNAITDSTTNQVRMGFATMTDTDRITVNNPTGSIVVWNINDESAPVQYIGSTVTNSRGEKIMTFAPGNSTTVSQYIAFDPQKSLMKITGYENVDNQNLHGLETPDMVILTNKTFETQAKRIATHHERKDRMTVHVIDQEQVFNEFSSGTPDAMAVRLMNKMFYDRDSIKFKYFLVLGCGSFDNRGIMTNKENRVITFESNCSNDEDSSFVSDDFYGYLDDNSGAKIILSQLRLGVGRIPSANYAEARSDVDKLLNYVNNPDYGVWRNNAMITADDGEQGLHIIQADRIGGLLNDELNTGFHVDKSYVPMYPKATENSEKGINYENKTATGARSHMNEMLKAGQYFATYVGHADATTFTKRSHMWTTGDVQKTSYEHLPIMTTACCDVARYDSDNRGIAEIMFHKKDGGAIALFTSSRQVYASQNDILNTAFVKALFPFEQKKTLVRLGDAYRLSKKPKPVDKDRIDRYNNNKMSFLLLGDPAMKVNYPKPMFKISKINGAEIKNSSKFYIRPLQTITVEARVLDSDMNGTDTGFNGDAYVTLYDEEREFTSFHSRIINYPRNRLARVRGRVSNGVFTATITVPRNTQSKNKNGILSVYAHRDDSEEMVNGRFTEIYLLTYDENAVTNKDTSAPEITSMYFNDENSFAEGEIVPASSILYITASDNQSINTQSVSAGSGMTLLLDGGKSSYSSVANFATAEDNGKNVFIAYPINNLAVGHHTITFTIYDASGNYATKTIPFVVGPASKASLLVEEIPAIDKATFSLESELSVTPTMTIKVTDATGNLLWTKTTSSFPVTWDLKDKNGVKLAPGLYKYFGTYEAGKDYGGTEIKNLIVIDGHKSNQ